MNTRSLFSILALFIIAAIANSQDVHHSFRSMQNVNSAESSDNMNLQNSYPNDVEEKNEENKEVNNEDQSNDDEEKVKAHIARSVEPAAETQDNNVDGQDAAVVDENQDDSSDHKNRIMNVWSKLSTGAKTGIIIAIVVVAIIIIGGIVQCVCICKSCLCCC
ncbi:hypothetical protein RS030_2366 [Cryptosporidium xiaoi]|uniref:Uncharacterized protein n=1 Tax=Cryptosporidium xiaoi TaxID=659607 RepID=A0AAV9Y2A9_9CRYT